MAPFKSLEIRPEGKCTACPIFREDGIIRNSDATNSYIQNSDISTIWNSPWLNDLRQRFTNEEKRPECQLCWDKEDAGVVSLRQQFNNDYDLKKVEEPVIDELMIRFSNECNSACRVCYSWYNSSLWEKEFSETGRHNTKHKDHNSWFDRSKVNKINEKNWEDWKKHLGSVQKLFISGGEPLIMKESIKVIDYLVESGNSKNINLRLVTNGTVTDEFLFEKLNTFKSVDLNFSIDDIGERYDYERWPCKFDAVMKNLKEIHDSNKYSNINFSFNTVISVFNILHLKDILEKFKEFPKWNVSFDYISQYPQHVSIASVPENLKLEIKNYLDTFDWTDTNWKKEDYDYKSGIIDFLSVNKSDLQLSEYVDLLDSGLKIDDERRHQDWRKTFSKLNDLLDI